jgi:RimJ/RimL family protein N-acetyltransferase
VSLEVSVLQGLFPGRDRGAVHVIDARNYNADAVLRDGTPVTVRAILGADREDVLAVFKSQNRESVYTRFFTYKKALTDAELSQISEVDFDHVVALVVTMATDNKEQLIGGGRYASSPPLYALRSAELAFMTRDDFRNKGVASLILRHLVEIGRAQGMLRFEAEVLACNPAMLAVFRQSGLPIKARSEDGVVHVVLSLE